ncbi:ATP-dependent DNA helicase [Myxococcus sp. MxC21-1]|uniref:ATP-dependent DNA helicase n=1 Tax=Myxococcus sp. MxC21-1 TaxID=3041439 RepID=UPI002930183B|nr:ATP-dependent DNA helicase [Myxococcus sp. MxC21-1]WNZ61922.1 ATP-dependent DNA helicase [Myxococcus sp. MxC21-1]
MRGKLMRVLVVIAMSVGSPVLAQGVHGASGIQAPNNTQAWARGGSVDAARQRAENERLERERLARLERARQERERIARMERERQERERIARLERERQERERIARLERERQERARWNRGNPMHGRSASSSRRG